MDCDRERQEREFEGPSRVTVRRSSLSVTLPLGLAGYPFLGPVATRRNDQDAR